MSNPSENSSPMYKVFPCPKCGKWQYTKATKATHRCICGSRISVTKITAESIAGVNNAHKLCRQQNIAWQTAKGIQIGENSCIRVSPKKHKPSSSSCLRIDQEEQQNTEYVAILDRVLAIVRAQQIPEPIPLPFFAAIYQSVNSSTISLARFLGYWDTHHRLKFTQSGICTIATARIP
jgi:hypothetical protein